jgi:hypothetical protein
LFCLAQDPKAIRDSGASSAQAGTPTVTRQNRTQAQVRKVAGIVGTFLTFGERPYFFMVA